MDYTVEQLQRRDINEYLALTKYIDGETDFFGSEPTDPRPSILNIINSTKNGNTIIFVAKNKNGLVGHLGAFWRRGKNARLKHSINVGLGVAKEFWGNGIGSALMEAFIEWCKNNQLLRIELEVMTHNERAIALYEKMGFVLEGTKRQSIRINGEYIDEHLMALILE